MQVFVYLVLILIGIFFTIMILIWIRDYLISKDRIKDKKEDFIDNFNEQGISESLTLSVYRYLQDWMNIKNFPVRPQDNIANIYGIADEDLDDFILEIAAVNNLEVPANTNYWQGQIVTVEDLIKFINTFPPRNANKTAI